jgi:hypothetical protein
MRNLRDGTRAEDLIPFNSDDEHDEDSTSSASSDDADYEPQEEVVLLDPCTEDEFLPTVNYRRDRTATIQFSIASYVCSRLVASYYFLLFVFTTDDISLFWDVMAKDDDSSEGKKRTLTTSDLARKDYPPSAFGTEESQPLSTDPS